MNVKHERWPDGPSDGLWIKVRESKWIARVAHFMPSTFDSYARILHPLTVYRRGDLSRSDLRWSEVAGIEGTAVHPRIELPELLRIDDSRVESLRAKGVEGVHNRLPDRDWDFLGRILRRHTATPSFMIGIWEGWGSVPEPAKHQTLLELPHRRYSLVEIPFDSWSTNSIIGHYSANLFWPKDRSWFMNNDVDAGSTYVGGTAEAIAEILDSPDLESAKAELEDEVLKY